MTARPITIQELQTADIVDFVDVIRRGFDPARIDTTIYGCPGIASFIRRQLGLPASFSNKLYMTALADGRLAGCLEMRSLPESMFLDYIATSPDCRSRGVGTRLFAEGIRRIRQDSHREIHLDVFADNAPALGWYTKLGFKPVRATNTWAIPLERQAEFSPGTITDFPQAEASQQMFGFSRFRLVTSEREYDIGRLGDRWFRVTDVRGLVDPAVGSTLFQLDDKRKILAMIGEETTLPDRVMPAAHLLAATLRLSAPLDTVTLGLEGS